jgi:hypothetical protein
MYIRFFLIFIFFVSCTENHKFEDFRHVDNKKEELEFLEDSRKCEEEKDKFSNKIQGREFGFEGADTGYLGCMRLKGWSQKKTS